MFCSVPSLRSLPPIRRKKSASALDGLCVNSAAASAAVTCSDETYLTRDLPQTMLANDVLRCARSSVQAAARKKRLKTLCKVGSDEMR
jgi:hypothetical protein